MSGNIPPDIASQLITALAAQSKIIETDDLTKRIEILESKNGYIVRRQLPCPVGDNYLDRLTDM
jgi:hypothetical protein